MPYAPRISIIGGGLTGAAAAIELLRSVHPAFDLTIIEPEERLGRGLAYGRAAPFHLLNVRAGRLGVLHQQPGDFAAWARGQCVGIRPPPPEQPEPSRAFLSRRLFGAYVEARLRAEVASRPDVNFTHLRSVAVGVRRCVSGYEIEFDNQPPIIVQFVILATGYGCAPLGSNSEEGAFAHLEANTLRTRGSALFIGTGLTFVDEFLRLRRNGFRGEALAISRRGLLPEVHRANETPKNIGLAAGNPDPGRLFFAFRRAMEQSELPASAAVDLVLGLREGGIQPLWQSLGVRRQRRFLRHLRPYWNVARHRLAPEIHAQLRHALQNGMVRVATGRVLHRDGNEFSIHMRGEEPLTRRFDLVLDCTGFRPDIGSPLARSLTDQGLARIDPHQLGLKVAPDGALLTRHGTRSPGLFALGPLGHGSLYEITAVPEIVAQAAAMAETLRAEMRQQQGVERQWREYRAALPRAG